MEFKPVDRSTGVEVRCQVPHAQRTLFLCPDMGPYFSQQYLARQFLLRDESILIYTSSVVNVAPKLHNRSIAFFLAAPGPFYIVGEIDETRATLTVPDATVASPSPATQTAVASPTSFDHLIRYISKKEYPAEWLHLFEADALENRKRALRKRAQNYSVVIDEYDKEVLFKKVRTADGRDEYKKVLRSSNEVWILYLLHCLII